jgi:hypothetical protein
MLKLAEEVLDFYDDPKGTIFRKRFPDPSLIPDFLKQAQLLSPEDRKSMQDDLFALVLNDDGKKLKKYARNDKANTALSVVYFLDNGAQKLPEDFTKIAAKNLVQGCLWYKIEPPAPLIKIAEEKTPVDVYIEPNVESTKVAAVPPAPDSKLMALPSQDRYPLDSYRDTMNAAKFFEKYASRFHPNDRREYASNLEKRADDLGIPVSRDVRLYASKSFADKTHISNQVHMRMEKTSGLNKQKYALFYEKIASVTPGTAAQALSILDEEAGLDNLWDGQIYNPYRALLQEKVAEEYAFHDMHGSVTDEDIRHLANVEQINIEKALGKDFYKTFKDDPVAIFKSLPLPEKRVLIRLMASRLVS